MADEVSLTLSRDEALVMFEWLCRMDWKARVADDWSAITGHLAEQQLIWNLTCLLERELTEPLRPDYRQLVESARQRMIGDA